MFFKDWLNESFRALHQVGFMPGTKKNVLRVIQRGKLESKTGLIWLRPESSAELFSQMPEYRDMVWVKVQGNPNILKVANRQELMQVLDFKGHTDNPEVSEQIAAKLQETGYDGFERLDFPEIAILASTPHEVIGSTLEN